MKKIFESRPDLKKYNNPLNWIGYLPFKKDKISRLIEQAEYLRDKDFERGYKLLQKGKKLYGEIGYQKEIDIKISEVFKKYKKLLESALNIEEKIGELIKNSPNPNFPMCPE